MPLTNLPSNPNTTSELKVFAKENKEKIPEDVDRTAKGPQPRVWRKLGCPGDQNEAVSRELK